jgi:hypothetical protein
MEDGVAAAITAAKVQSGVLERTMTTMCNRSLCLPPRHVVNICSGLRAAVLGKVRCHVYASPAVLL